MSELKPKEYFIAHGGCTETETCHIQVVDVDSRGVDVIVTAKAIDPATRAQIEADVLRRIADRLDQNDVVCLSYANWIREQADQILKESKK